MRLQQPKKLRYNSMKKKILIYSLVTMGILGIAGIGVVSAHGEFGWLGTFDAEKFVERQQTMF